MDANPFIHPFKTFIAIVKLQNATSMIAILVFRVRQSFHRIHILTFIRDIYWQFRVSTFFAVSVEFSLSQSW